MFPFRLLSFCEGVNVKVYNLQTFQIPGARGGLDDHQTAEDICSCQEFFCTLFQHQRLSLLCLYKLQYFENDDQDFHRHDQTHFRVYIHWMRTTLE